MNIILIITMALLAGCATIDTQVYSKIDPNRKNIRMPVGNDGINGKIKQLLRKNNYKIIVLNDQSVSSKKGNITIHKNKNQVDYTFMITSEKIDWCLNLERLYTFDLTVVDNLSGEEVLATSGKHCEKRILKEIQEHFTK